jgi:nucleolar protein TMA23
MPLDGHSYLVAQGWTGKGTGLRQGAISRPLAIPQKKTLAGLGKERDEAFPFWDQRVLSATEFFLLLTTMFSLFSAASKSIQIKISNDDDDDDSVSTAS